MDWKPVADILQCGDCGAHGLSHSADAITCRCGFRMRIEDGVLVMPGRERPPGTLSQKAMGFRPLVRIYDTLWRRLTFPALTFIPLSREVRTVLGYHGGLSGRRVLDLACGPGTYASRFAGAVGASGIVIGVDASSTMLRQAVASARREGLTNLYFVLATAEGIPFQDASFDGINCTGALHLFPDPERVLREIRRLLREDGAFSCMTFVGGAVPGIDGAFRSIGIRMFAPEVLRSMLAREGLAEVQATRSRRVLLFSAKRVPTS